jgi:hypothetical protein
MTGTSPSGVALNISMRVSFTSATSIAPGSVKLPRTAAVTDVAGCAVAT